MDIIEIANQYPEVPVPIFEEKFNLIITEIESLQRLLQIKLFFTIFQYLNPLKFLILI